MEQKYHLQEKIWLYPGKAGWYFVTIPADVTQDIDFSFSHLKKGWGSLRVKVTIGETTWMTSIFPDKETKCYLLPVKAEVRKKEKISADQKITLVLEVKNSLFSK